MKGRVWKLPKLREAARAIFQAGLKVADPEDAVLRYLERKGDLLRIGSRTYRLSRLNRVFVVGAGKACAPMARAVEQTLGNKLTASPPRLPGDVLHQFLLRLALGAPIHDSLRCPQCGAR